MRIPFLTADGLIDLADPPETEFGALRLATGLAKINRFNGRTIEPLPVAVHSVLVSRLCPPEARAWGLLHDAHEALLGDFTRPAVELLAAICPDVPAAIASAKWALDVKIAAAWGVERRVIDVARADHAACYAEMHLAIGGSPVAVPEHLADDVERAIAVLLDMPMSIARWRDARDLWFSEARDLAALGHLRLPDTKTETAI